MRKLRMRARRVIARHTALRVAGAVVAFGAALLPGKIRALFALCLLIPGPLDEIAVAVTVVMVIAVALAVSARMRDRLRGSVRLAAGARYLTEAAEQVAAAPTAR